jgi:hypothetical protein
VLGLSLTGCASVVSLVSQGGLDQEVTITSDPPGAKISHGFHTARRVPTRGCES